MAVEGDHERNRIMLAGVGDGLPDDLLVAEMHAVENADGQTDFAAAVAQFVCDADNFHLMEFLPRMDKDKHV
jgi:hypothetical protein